MSCVPPVFTPVHCGDRFIGNTDDGLDGEHYFELSLPAGITSITADTCLSAFDTKLSVFHGAGFCAGTTSALETNDDDSTGYCTGLGDETGRNAVLAAFGGHPSAAGDAYMCARRARAPSRASARAPPRRPLTHARARAARAPRRAQLHGRGLRLGGWRVRPRDQLRLRVPSAHEPQPKAKSASRRARRATTRPSRRRPRRALGDSIVAGDSMSACARRWVEVRFGYGVGAFPIVCQVASVGHV
jgi:hypothetical protein